MKLILLLTLFSLINLTAACFQIMGTYEKDNNYMIGNAFDDGIQTCQIHRQLDMAKSSPGYWDCIEGYHGFVDWDFTYWAYDTPHSKDMRLSLGVWNDQPNFLQWYAAAWNC